MGDSKTMTVQTEGGDVIVRKLALGDYAALLRALKNLPKEIGKFINGNDKEDLRDNNLLFSNLPVMIADSIPEFCEILAIVSDKDAKFFEDGDLADAIEVFAAAYRINDYSRIAATLKKMTAQKPVPQTDPTAAA